MMQPPPPAKQPSETNVRGIYTSENVSLEVPFKGHDGRPPPVKYTSLPAYHSPLRHHKRAASSTRRVKETLNARSEYSNSEDDGTAQHRINQYLIKQEIGRGSFGAVHLAVDQYGHEYAVKEFSKSRLRKRAQSNLLRRPSARRRRQGALAAGLGFNSPLHRHSSTEENNSLDLIKEEIAIMKKLNHPNVVSLIEVLDDPEEDSLYMVMEMCKKGVVMQVGLDERADPYPEEQCRCWFRDMILGLEYLHAQGIIHRDIKPDNCLVTDDDVLKIVDFGVSEMFDKEGQMKTAKSAGSPAFMPPELCVAKHGEVDGRAVDIWSAGVTLYCLMFGRIPFEKHGMLELYEAIRTDDLEVDECNPDLRDLLRRLLEKDPQKRLRMDAIREHPWVTRRGTDPLLSAKENVSILVEPPTDEEVNAAITGNMGHLVTVVRAVKRFKQLLFRRRPERLEGILGSASRIVQPPLSMRPSGLRKSKSQDTDNRRPIEGALTTEGVHREIEVDEEDYRVPRTLDEMAYSKPGIRSALSGTRSPKRTATSSGSPLSPQPISGVDAKVIHENMSYRPTTTKPIAVPATAPSSVPTTPLGKGHAHDPLQDTLYLNIGTGDDYVPPAGDTACIVSESPGAVDIDVYETAYREEVDRIVKRRESTTPGRRPTLYLTRRVENVKSLVRDHDRDLIFDHGKSPGEVKQDVKGGFKSFVEKAKLEIEARGELQKLTEGKEGKLSRITRNVREKKRLVEEEREIIRREDRERERERVAVKERSRSSTPVASVRGPPSRSVTPVTPVLAEK